MSDEKVPLPDTSQSPPQYQDVVDQQIPPQQLYPPQQQPYPSQQQQPYPEQQKTYPEQSHTMPVAAPNAPQRVYVPPVQEQPYPPQQHTVPVATPYAPERVYLPLVQNQPLTKGWGDQPTKMTCANCKTQQTSVTVKKAGIMSWIVVGITVYILFSLLLWPCIPCALFALKIDSFKNTEHTCPNCKHVNGIMIKYC